MPDGWDNIDWGASGLLFLYDGLETTSWKWAYSRELDEAAGSYRITESSDDSKEAPADLVSRITVVLDYAAREADFWPGS